MPVYEYICPSNGRTVEVVHSIKTQLNTWEDLCEHAHIPFGDTPKGAAVERLLFPVGVSTPAGNSRLKELGFTKLVKRDNGVYENVTASGDEKKYMKAGDSSSLPNFTNKIND